LTQSLRCDYRGCAYHDIYPKTLYLAALVQRHCVINQKFEIYGTLTLFQDDYSELFICFFKFVYINTCKKHSLKSNFDNKSLIQMLTELVSLNIHYLCLLTERTSRITNMHM